MVYPSRYDAIRHADPAPSIIAKIIEPELNWISSHYNYHFIGNTKVGEHHHKKIYKKSVLTFPKIKAWKLQAEEGLLDIKGDLTSATKWTWFISWFQQTNPKKDSFETVEFWT